MLTLSVPAVVALDAERPEVGVVERHSRVLPVVRRQPGHVMDVLGRSQDPPEQTVLAERMQLEVGRPASLPGRPIVKGLGNRPGHRASLLISSAAGPARNH